MNDKDRKRIIKVGVSGLVVAGLLVGSVEYASHTWLYDCAGAQAAERTVSKTAEIRPLSAGKTDDDADDSAVSKEETVYATLDADGQTNQIIVSDWLKNSGKADSVSDVSDLKDIVNTKGEEKFTQDGEKLSWDTSDEDIYYQGTSDGELPVGVSIEYELDGESVQPADIVGKSGKLTIRIKYQNNAKSQIDVGGDKEEIYTPFLMATGMILPVDKFSNVTIDNGNVISEGDNEIVVAYGMPGLKESLNLDGLDLGDEVDLDTDSINDKLTDTVEITADVKDFSIGSTYTVATSELFRDLEIDDADDLDDLDDKIDDIKDASSSLVDGTESLQEGLETLDENFATYADAIDTVDSGVSSLSKGTKQLNKGTKQYTKGVDKLIKGVNSYASGAKKLSKGMKSYVSGANTLVNGIATLNKSTSSLPEQYQTFESGLKTFVNSVTTLLSEENMTSLSQGAQSLQEGVAQVDTGVKAVQKGVSTVNDTVKKLEKTDELEQCVTGLKQMKSLYTKQAEAAQTDSEKKQYQEMAAALEGAIQYIEGGEQAAAALDAATNGKADGEQDAQGTEDLALALAQIQAATDTESEKTNLYTGAKELSDSASTIAGYAEQLRSGASDLLTGSTKLNSGLSQISSAIKKLNSGGKQLQGSNKAITDGANSIIKNTGAIQKGGKQVKKSSPSLRKATKQLASGTQKLASGLGKLVQSTGKVADGISKLADGSGELSDGMNEFQDEAVIKLTDTMTDMTDGLDDFTDRIKGVRDASKEYQSYSGLADDMEGSVKFVMSTEEVK